MIAEFSLLLTLGISSMWCLMPRSKVTAGFFRIQMLLSMGLSMLTILSLGHLTVASGGRLSGDLLLAARIASGFGLFCGYIGSIVWTLDRRFAGTIAMMGIALSTLVSLICSRGGISALASQAELFHLTSSLATAGVLGGSVTGMLLGHWYLTAPTMSIDPLKTLSLYFGIAVVFRLAVSALGCAIAGQSLHGGVQWTWFSLRWLAGIIGPMIIAVMALQILKYRNTQAATGVLFAGVILSFIGEMSAALLYSELHVPL